MNSAEVVRRALSAYGKNWSYVLGAKPDFRRVPEGAANVQSDCTGYVWWATGHLQVDRLSQSKLWRSSPVPVVGGAVWHDARPPAKYGHAGLVIKVYPNGDFDSLDCGSTPPGPRNGAIRLVRGARSFWSKNGTASFGFWAPTYIDKESAGFGAVGALLAVAAAAAAIWYFSREA
jgi:hypothetical protein